MGVITVDEKEPGEIIPVAFDFSALVDVIDSVIISISVRTGIDVNVSTMLFGTSIITDAVITQLIRNGLDTNVYKIKADIFSGSKKYSLALHLPVNDVV